MKNTKMKELLQKLGTLLALFILILIFSVTMPQTFPKVSNAMNILKEMCIRDSIYTERECFGG